MEVKIFHIAPFDIGCSFFDYEYSKRHNKDAFVNSLGSLCGQNGFEILELSDDKFFFGVKLNRNVSCFLQESGIGVFVFYDLDIVDLTSVHNAFKDHFLCEVYYRKKKEQNAILERQTDEIKTINSFMDMVWRSVNKNDRPFSASKDYKYNGLSYIMSVYHIIDDDLARNPKSDTDMGLLMNPSVISEIAYEEKWSSIKNKLVGYTEQDFNFVQFDSMATVLSSWSAVAVIEHEGASTDALKVIVQYEMMLQSGWFLFDCLIDDIKKSRMSNLDLQKEKSVAASVSLELSNILSANMNTKKKNVMEMIYQTSGLDTVQKKLFLLFENRIAVAEAKISEKHSVYGIITEILLVLFTLVSIYEPVAEFVKGSLDTVDLIIGAVMLAVLGMISFLIIRKER